MAGEKAQNLQDTFLNHVRKSKTSVTIFLVNGVKLQGFVTWFDNFCLLLVATATRNWSISTRSPRSCRPLRSKCSRRAKRRGRG